MFVTAVIPCYNHAKWVNEAIDSVASQDYPHKQIIVVDDGSTDNSHLAVLNRLYRPRGPKEQGSPWIATGQLTHSKVEVTILRFTEAKGPSRARNAGIDHGWAETDIFAFLDSDDLYEPGKISKSIAVIKDDPTFIGAVYSDFDTFNSEIRIRQHKPSFSRQRLLRECIVNCDSLVTKRAIEVCGAFDETIRVCEDYDMWLRISEKFIITHIPESLVRVRVGSHSASSTISKENWQKNYQKVFDKLRARQ